MLLVKYYGGLHVRQTRCFSAWVHQNTHSQFQNPEPVPMREKGRAFFFVPGTTVTPMSQLIQLHFSHFDGFFCFVLFSGVSLLFVCFVYVSLLFFFKYYTDSNIFLVFFCVATAVLTSNVNLLPISISKTYVTFWRNIDDVVLLFPNAFNAGPTLLRFWNSEFTF